jgi:putative IMPACT (imprinted ancient) family translation regulator
VPIVAMARLGLHVEFAELALLKARLKELQAEVEQEDFGATGSSCNCACRTAASTRPTC